MADLWEVLGYDRVATSIAARLQNGEDLCVVEGPPGVGKTWLTKDLGVLWEESGGSTVLAEGDSLRGDAYLYPFTFAMGGLPRGWKSLGTALASMGKAGETLIGTGGLITSTVEALVKTGESRRRNRTMLLGATEQTILHELERLSKKRPLLFIADNLHWWDSGSLGFLSRLRDPRLWEAFPFLSELRILATQTPEPYQSVSNPAAHEALLLPSKTASFELPRIPHASFSDVLVALGAKPRPSDDLADLVYSFSGGNLALASRCAERIAAGESAVFLSASDDTEFLRALLTERISSLGALGKQAVDMLQIAAILGLTFRRAELCCASQADEAETLRLLRQCRGEGVLEVADGLDRFVHDVYRQHFLSLSSDKAGVHETLSNCLRSSRPGEYELRCLNATNAERPDEAAVFAIHAALQREREGRPWEELPPAILDALSSESAVPIVELLTDALRCLRICRFTQCISTLDRLPRRLAKSVAAEADYLRAMCLMSTRSEEDRAKGRLLLETWEGYIEEEPEIGTRLMLLLLYGLFHISDKQPGWALEARIVHLLSDRASYDPAAEDALYALDRCAGGLHPADAALGRVREAAAHFGPKEGQLVVRRPGEYYRCMVNLVAKLIENGEYEEAYEKSLQLGQFIAEYGTEVFARAHYPFTNQLQAEYRLGSVDAEEAAGRQMEIVEEFGVEDDPFYPENALAVYLALAGRYDEAFQILDRLDGELTHTRTSPEPSMTYLIRGNRCAVTFVSGDLERAQPVWAALTETAAESNYTDRDVLLLRHELLAREIAAGNRMTSMEFDIFLLEHHPDRQGPLWKNFGHGFVLPALELWRGES